MSQLEKDVADFNSHARVGRDRERFKTYCARDVISTHTPV